MDQSLEDRQTRTSSVFCASALFDCFSPKQASASSRIAVEDGAVRETNVLYHQPHLVEPMRLRVYDDLPATLATPEPSQISQWGRNIASRASSRASRISMKRRTTSKSMISRPMPVSEPASDDLPLRRRRREFTPLQLSIYDTSNRLSDLPEFDRLSFTDVGELKRPPRALVRAHSEQALQTVKTFQPEPKRIASMFEVSGTISTRPHTSHSIISTSRPPSEYDALHSHPVSVVSAPGVIPPKTQKLETSFSILTPMQEEFSPIGTAITVDGTVLRFPNEVQRPPRAAVVSGDLDSITPETQAPFPVISRGPSTSTTRSRQPSLRPYFHTSYQTHRRISQWLHYRSESNSSMTLGSVSTGASFAEHRRKRSEFYKLNQQPQVNNNCPASPPQALGLLKSSEASAHHRTNTESTIQSTVGTSVLSSDFDRDSKRFSHESMTTLALADLNSRTGTLKSVLSPKGFRIVTVEEKEIAVSSTPVLSTEIEDHHGMYLDEIHGPLRSPGVGVAF